MNRERAALAIALAALILGLAADLLLRWIPWGVNAALWTFLFIGAAFFACRAAGRSIHPFPVVAAGLASLGLVWRDSPVLALLDVGLLVVLLPMLALSARGVRLAATGLSQIGVAVATTGFQAIAGGPQLLAADLAWSRMPRVHAMRGAGVAVRGTAMAVPALLLFGALLTSADANFERVLLNLVAFDLQELLLHIFVTALAAGICAGFLRSFALSGAAPKPSRPEFLRMPAAETNIALALVNILFATFVAVQARYFFVADPSLTYSQYARRGFFELVWVVALVVPMLLVIEWLIDKSNGARLFRTLALVQIALVLVIAFSAYRRMQLYREAFGLTELRVYTTAFMIWIAAVLVWLAVTVMSGRRERFAIGALTTAVLTVVALHAINPDALIVATNIERAKAGRRAFDARYALRLSDDAAEVIYANREMFPAEALQRFTDEQRPTGWRTWNAARSGVERHAADRTARP